MAAGAAFGWSSRTTNNERLERCAALQHICAGDAVYLQYIHDFANGAISTAARRRGVTTASLAGIILDRRIPLYFEGAYAEDFRAFRVHPGSLNGIYRRPQEPVASSWSVARLLKISRPTVYRLRQAGFLAPPTKRKSVSIRGGKYSCRKSLEEFQAAHVSLNELVERSGRSADDEFNHQISNGALPLPLGLRSTMIFRRSDVA